MKSFLSSILLAIGSLIFQGSLSTAAARSNDPVINKAIPDPTNSLLTITGANFGSAKPVVKLAGIGLTVNAGWTSTTIVAQIPANTTPGSYVLTVSGCTSDFQVTLGAVGPPGPLGPIPVG